MHIMIDLETMGTSVNAPILAIGAVCFDDLHVWEGDDGESDPRPFYRTISLESAVDFGASIEPATVIWWLKQSEEARNELVNAKADLKETLWELANWILECEPDGIWGNGAAFDNAILADAYRKADLPHFQWSHKMDRCYRTERAMSPVKMKPRTGTYHNALDDALNQAHHLVAIWKHEREKQHILQEALKEYANKENWRRVGLMPNLPCWAVHDAGETARKALEKIGEDR